MVAYAMWLAQLVLVPVGVWLYAVSPELWNLGFLGKLLCLLTVAATTADMVFLAAAYLSDPGILPTTLVDDDVVEGEDAPRGSGGWHMGMAPPTAKGQHYRIIVRGQRYQLIEFRAKFCRETENCIENFDHYCPWVGNAVGRRNYRYFVFFVAGANLVAACVFGGSTVVVVLVAQANGGGVALAVALAPLPVFLIVYTVIILCTVGGTYRTLECQRCPVTHIACGGGDIVGCAK
jgi:palmitoyltransferase ZDHHC9/14/18